MVLRFFGLTPTHRTGIFSQIHEIVFNAKGGYSWETVYNMPIWLRNFTFTKLKDFYEKQNEDSQQPTKANNIPKGPNIQPSYSTKASK